MNDFKNIFNIINKITGKKYTELEKFVNQAIKSGENPFLIDFCHFLEDVEYILSSKNNIAKIARRDKKIKDISFKYNDLQYLSHLMVIHKNSGIPLYNYSFAEKFFDPVLISGFLTAILSFQESSKIKGDNLASEKSGFELSYGNFIILLNSGQYINVALILDKEPSYNLRSSLVEFISQFENRFETNLKIFAGNVQVFQQSYEMVERIFEPSLLWPHRVNLEINIEDIEKNLSSFHNIILTMALSIQKETNYFLLPTLIEKVNALRNYSTERILATYYELKQEDYFIIFPISKMDEILEKELEAENIKDLTSSLDEDQDILASVEGVPKKLLDKINSHLRNTSYLFQKLIINEFSDTPKKDKPKYLKELSSKWNELKKDRDYYLQKVERCVKSENIYDEIINYLELKSINEELGFEDDADENANLINTFMEKLKELDTEKYKVLFSTFNKELSNLIENAEIEMTKKRSHQTAFLYKKSIRCANQLGNRELAKSLELMLSKIEN